MAVSRPNSLDAKDTTYLVHPYTNLAVHEDKGPMIIDRAEGIRLYDESGNSYIDGLGGLWCVSLGFSEKRLQEAARKQLETLPFSHSFAHRSHKPVIELAEKLVSMAPEPIARAFFTNSGSESVDTAIKTIWYYNNALDRPEKKKIIGRERAYHGVLCASGSLTALPYASAGFDMPVNDRFFKVSTPCHYRYGREHESEEDFATRLAQELDDLIVAEGPETVAAFFAEPLMGAGGVMPPPRTYFDKVQKVLKKHDVLFVADEVICGFGRTGSMWGSETYGIRPDLVTCAKQLSSAYLPIGAVLMSEDIYGALRSHSAKLGVFGIGLTYGGHPVSAAVALETLRIYEEDDILGHVQAISPHFQKRLQALEDHPLVGDARGAGLIGGLELVKDKVTKENFDPAEKVGPMAVEEAQHLGLLNRATPFDTFALCPPLIVTEADIDDIFDKTEAALNAVQKRIA